MIDKTKLPNYKVGDKIEIFKQITNEMIELYEKKNHDYGDSFSILFEKRGMDYLIPRLLEKIMRIESVAEKGNLADESIEDSLRDLCNYSIMALIELYGDRDEDRSI